jgi:hypothetical protein
MFIQEHFDIFFPFVIHTDCRSILANTPINAGESRVLISAIKVVLLLNLIFIQRGLKNKNLLGCVSHANHNINIKQSE